MVRMHFCKGIEKKALHCIVGIPLEIWEALYGKVVQTMFNILSYYFLLQRSPRTQQNIFVEGFAQSSLCEIWLNMGTVTFLKNEKLLILMSKMKCFVCYFFLVGTNSKLYFPDTKVKTTLVFIFNRIKYWKLAIYPYTRCLRRIKVHKSKKNQFWLFFRIKILINGSGTPHDD